MKNFNCTIQELKRYMSYGQAQHQKYFNCTIQELKRGNRHAFGQNVWQFQLHHTGIKTQR